MSDSPSVMCDVASFVRATNQLCIAQGARDQANLVFPPDGVLWRGGSLPDDHRAFFMPGVKFRIPAMLATSAELALTYQFVYRAYDEVKEPDITNLYDDDVVVSSGSDKDRVHCQTDHPSSVSHL